jgi:hypothetical protein
MLNKIKSFDKYKLVLFSIIIINFTAQLVVHLYIMNSNNGEISNSKDGLYYLDIAHSIRNLESTTTGNYYFNNKWYKSLDIGATLMPGYSLLIAPFFENMHLITLFQTLLLSIGFYFLFKSLHNKYLLVFVFITPLWIIVGTSWSYHNQALTESTTISFLLIIIYFLDKYFKDFKLKDIIILSILFGILISINNRYIFHYCGFLPFLFALKYFEKRIKIKHLIYSFLIVSAIMAPWHIRQYFVYGKFILFSPINDARLENSNEKIKSLEEYYIIQNFKSYLKDSLHHPLRDKPKELEEARKLFLAKSRENEENYLTMKEEGTLPKIKPSKLVFEPSKIQISDSAKNDLASGSIINSELLQKRMEIAGIKPIAVQSEGAKAIQEDEFTIIKYNPDGSINNDDNTSSVKLKSNPNVGKGSIAYVIDHRKKINNNSEKSLDQYAFNSVSTNTTGKNLNSKKKNKSTIFKNDLQNEKNKNTVTIAYNENVVRKQLNLAGTLNNYSKLLNGAAIQPENLTAISKEILNAIRSKDYIFLQRNGIINDSLIYDSLNLELTYSVLIPKAIDNIHLKDNKTLLVDNKSFSIQSDKVKNDILNKYNIKKTEADKLLASNNNKIISEIKNPLNVPATLSQSEKSNAKSKKLNYESRLVFLDREKYLKLSTKEK